MGRRYRRRQGHSGYRVRRREERPLELPRIVAYLGSFAVGLFRGIIGLVKWMLGRGGRSEIARPPPLRQDGAVRRAAGGAPATPSFSEARDVRPRLGGKRSGYGKKRRRGPRPDWMRSRPPRASGTPVWNGIPFGQEGSNCPPPLVGSAWERPKMPFKRSDGLLTKGERAFWYPLYYAVKGKYRIFPKVRLGDVVSGREGDETDRFWFQKIAGYHLDFVLCDPETTRPVMVVELDDTSHRTEKAIRRDGLKDRVLGDAGIPILRVKAAEAYGPAELVHSIETAISLRTT